MPPKRVTAASASSRPKRGSKAAAALVTSASATAADAQNSSKVHAEHLAFWRELPDAEFFGPNVTHLYYYSDVDDDSVLQLRSSVLDAAQATQRQSGGSFSDDGSVLASPKPIVIHVHSRGGSMFSENWLMSLYNQVHVPLCVMVDGLSASAATALSVMAPYRVMTEYSLSLLHDYAGGFGGKREELQSQITYIEHARALYKKIYMARTNISDADLERLLRRDLWLGADACLAMGICDRILRSPQQAARARSAKLLKSVGNMSPFFKTNWNRVFTTCGAATPQRLDSILGLRTAKPIVYITPGTGDCEDPKAMLGAIARIQHSPVPVFGIVDNSVSWWEMLPVLFCHRRYMYENALLYSDMVYISTWGYRLQDIVDNAQADRALITKAITQQARPTKELLANLFDRAHSLTAQQCLENGLIDEIVPLDAFGGRRRGGK